jgi:serine/threonine-protein kinase HipA
MGVFDGNRMGALRFKYAQEGEFMDNDKKLATPPVNSVRELEYASLQIEKEEFKSNDEYSKWLICLLPRVFIRWCPPEIQCCR